MKTPKRLKPLVEDGVINDVLFRMMSGKEADLFVVTRGNDTLCAKVYKEAAKRSFKQAVTYQEGRKVRSSRRARAMEKRTKFGRQQIEETWQTAEVDALYKLAAADVRVPEPFGCVDGVLLMELILDADGEVAPRLSDVVLTSEEALEDHAIVLRYLVRMLCTGIVHGDLSEFNVLLDAYGPVIIDLPQAVDAAGNNQAKAMFLRDVNKMTTYYAQFAPELADTHFAQEIWALYEDGDLNPDSELTGVFEFDTSITDVDAMLSEIESVMAEEEERKQRVLDAEEVG
jgi:RIO kinase 1